VVAEKVTKTGNYYLTPQHSMSLWVIHTL